VVTKKVRVNEQIRISPVRLIDSDGAQIGIVNKKAKEAKKKQHVIQMKELKLRSKIDEHDLQFKLRHARKFLEKQYKVKITMVFRGREVVHKELGERILQRVCDEVSDIASQEGEIKMEGRNMVLILIPKSHG